MKSLIDFCCKTFTFLFSASLVKVGLLIGAAAQPVPGGVCKPVSERTTEVGCWIIAHEPVGRLNEPQVCWHLDLYPTHAAAQEAKGPQGTVVESFGRVWLLTIAEEGWRPQGGDRVAQIGPLPNHAAPHSLLRAPHARRAHAREKSFEEFLPRPARP
jgi:hypothetical protein